MRFIFLGTLALMAAPLLRAQDTASVPTADGFRYPVGVGGTGEGYYLARGYMPNGHLGEDWNGVRGGDTDLGDPVYAAAHGIVVFAKNYHVGWGNVVMLRHAYYEGAELRYVDSLYGHLYDFTVQEGQQVRRGQLIGRIGNNDGMYDAHLHFEMRKNLSIGMYRSSFPRDHTNYWSPQHFIAARTACPGGNRPVSVPINTFPTSAPPSYAAGQAGTPVYAGTQLPAVGAGPTRSAQSPYPEIYAPTRASTATAGAKWPSSNAASQKTARTDPSGPTVLTNANELRMPPPSVSPIRRSSSGFRVDRFEDLRKGNGY